MERLDICVQHRDVVNALALNLNTKSLDRDIKSELGDKYTPSIAFQIKMELQRLNKLSTRPIRSHTINEKIKSVRFVFNGIEHHLDKKTLLRFQTLCAHYNNKYTIGVEESVLEFIKSNQEDIIQSQLNDGLECTPINMSEMIYRSEERMFLGIRVEMFLKPEAQDPTRKPDPKTFNTPVIHCVTQNISNGGLKAKSQNSGTPGEFYFVRYTGLEKDFSIMQPYILYKLIKCIKRPVSNGEPSYVWLMAKCESEYHSEFNNFLSKLITSNSGRYKVDIDNIQRSVLNNITEQFLTNRQNEIGLFFNEEGLALYAYGSVVSNKTYNDFLNSNKSNVFSALVEKDNLLEIAKGGYVFWATIKTEKGAYFSAPLTSSPLNRSFFNVALTRPGSKVFKVEQASINRESAFLEHTLPSKNRNKTFKTYSDRAKEAIYELGSLLVFTEMERESFAGLTAKEKGGTEVRHGYSEFSYKNEGEIHGPVFVKAACNELRKEDRFFFESKIKINHSSVEYEGYTNDISSYGVSLTIKNGVDIKRGSTVTAYFPDLKNKRGYIPQASYSVVDSHNGRVRLHANTKKTGAAKHFFSEFIERNYEKLTPVSIHGFPAGLERSLRNIFNATLSSAKGLIQVRSSRACINVVNVPPNSKSQSSLFEGIGAPHQNCAFSKSLFYLPKLQKHLTTEIREIGKDRPYSSRIFAVGHHEVNGEKTIAYHEIFEAKKANLNTLSNVASLLEKRGVKLSLFHISQTKKSRVYDNFYREELMYIERHAPHKHQSLCDLVRQTSGVFSITPIDSWLNKWA